MVIRRMIDVARRHAEVELEATTARAGMEETHGNIPQALGYYPSISPQE